MCGYQYRTNSVLSKSILQVLASADISPLIDIKKMYTNLKQNKNATSDAMFMALFQSIDVMKAVQNLDWQSLLTSGGISDSTVYVPGKQKGFFVLLKSSIVKNVYTTIIIKVLSQISRDQQARRKKDMEITINQVNKINQSLTPTIDTQSDKIFMDILCV